MLGKEGKIEGEEGAINGMEGATRNEGRSDGQRGKER